jgi:hypothetical protein
VFNLQSKTAGVIGNTTTMSFNIETVFSKIAEKIGLLDTSNINYTTATSTLYSTITTPGPYTYTVSNVPDLATNTHVITILSKGDVANSYGNALIVGSTPYTLQWTNGDNPSTIVSGLTTNDIITQQICILPTNFKSNSAISNISIFKSV